MIYLYASAFFAVVLGTAIVWGYRREAKQQEALKARSRSSQRDGHSDALATTANFPPRPGSPAEGRASRPRIPVASHAVSVPEPSVPTPPIAVKACAGLTWVGYVVVMMEKLMYPGEYLDDAVQQFIAANPTVYAGLADTRGFISNIGQPKGNWKRFSTRHHGGGNLLFADGHVSWFSWRDTQLPPSQLPFSATSDANQGDTIIWSIAGPIH